MLVDSITSQVNAQLWEKKKVHWFLVSVGFDQALHVTTLLVTIPLIK